MTVFTKTVQASGGDYTTLQSAWDDIGTGFGSTNLTTNPDTITFECAAETFAENVTFDGLTTDATGFVTVKPQSGAEHTGTLDTGPHWEPTGIGHIFTVLNSFTQLIGLEIERDAGGNNSDEGIRVGDSSNTAEGLLIDRCIIHSVDATASQDGIHGANYVVGSATNPVVVRNTVMTGWTRSGLTAQSYSNSARSHWWDIINCNIADSGDIGLAHRRRHGSTVITMRVVNTLIGDSVTADFAVESGTNSGTLVTTGSLTNWDELGEVPAASGSPNPIVYEFVDSPVATDVALFQTAYSDMSLRDVAANDVLDKGTGPDTSALVDDFDCVGAARTGTTTDPGAFQVTGGAAGVDPGAFLDRFEHTPAPNTLLRM